MSMIRPIFEKLSMRRLISMFAPVLPMLFLTACGGSNDGASSDKPRETGGAPVDTVAGDTVAATPPPSRPALSVPESQFREIKYTRLAITSRAVLDSIRKMYRKTPESDEAFRAITTLNRKEFGYIRVGDTIVTPDTITGDMRAYSVFPERYPAADTLPKLILISNKYQAYACYEYGQLVRFAACNTGTERKATFPGRYALNWKERLRISSLNENWKLPYTWNFHLHAGNAFHQFAMPGRPVSHSCVRQFMTDAEWLFKWGEGGRRDSSGRMVPFSGTPVLIIDSFDFTRPKGGPWLELTSNRSATLDLPTNPMGMEEAWIPMSQVPADARGGLPDRQRYVVAEDTLRARGVIREGVTLSASINYNKLRAAKAARKAVQKKPAAADPPKVDAE